MSNNYNMFSVTQRVFADAVSVEAWHEPFCKETKKADLRIDVTFKSGSPVGGEDESPVRFRLSLKRAEVVVIIPDDITYDRNSVARNSPSAKGRRTASVKIAKEGKLGAELSTSTSGIVSGKGEVSVEAKGSSNSSTEIEHDFALMMVMHLARRDGHAWEVKPSFNNALDGKPWNATTEPRLKIIDKRADASEQLSRILVEVRCRREDLDISDIELKADKNSSRNILRKKKNNMAAVEAYIRTQFAKAGLDIEVGEIDEKFRNLILVRATAQCNE